MFDLRNRRFSVRLAAVCRDAVTQCHDVRIKGIDAILLASMIDLHNGISATDQADDECNEYFGHASVLMVDDLGTWTVVSPARYDMETGEFEYDWDDGTIAY